MNILFISHLGSGVSAGPHWSVPARIKAQTKYDNVMWINATNASLPHYIETGVYHNLSEFRSLSLESFPAPFNKPDVVAFEGFYYVPSSKFAKELRGKGIPYVITPRGSLTRQARHNASRIKKDIAHLLFFDPFLKGARAIQYLTKQEQTDSKSPCKDSYVLPNGFSTPQRVKTSFSQDRIKGIFIGRIDLYHKGLDTLVEAVSSCLQMMKDKQFTIGVYGPKNEDAKKMEQLIAARQLVNIISLKGEIAGEAKENAILDSDVFILPSRFEGHPMGLVEALAYGLPCVVSTGTNMREEIEDADAGWTCYGTTDSLVRALIDVVNERHLFKKKSENAISLAKNYDWDVLAKKFHEKLEELI